MTAVARRVTSRFLRLPLFLPITTHLHTACALDTQPSRLPVPVGRHPGRCLLVTAPSAHHTTPHHTTSYHKALLLLHVQYCMHFLSSSATDQKPCLPSAVPVADTSRQLRVLCGQSQCSQQCAGEANLCQKQSTSVQFRLRQSHALISSWVLTVETPLHQALGCCPENEGKKKGWGCCEGWLAAMEHNGCPVPCLFCELLSFVALVCGRHCQGDAGEGVRVCG